MDNSKSSNFKYQSRGLLSFEEINELSNHLVPDVNNFGGYLRNNNFSEDRDNFLKSFGEELAKTETELHRYIPEYVGNKLVFRKTDITDCEESNDFVFNYQIHMIIYKGDPVRRKNRYKETLKGTNDNFIGEFIEKAVEPIEESDESIEVSVESMEALVGSFEESIKSVGQAVELIQEMVKME